MGYTLNVCNGGGLVVTILLHWWGALNILCIPYYLVRVIQIAYTSEDFTFTEHRHLGDKIYSQISYKQTNGP